MHVVNENARVANPTTSKIMFEAELRLPVKPAVRVSVASIPTKIPRNTRPRTKSHATMKHFGRFNSAITRNAPKADI
eukprot:CAMPEP_0184753282 /NCGR_PEP_ID=MMETSP0315-20130426/44022_1 /TAXON_ID=101924 /ORGANISM="Rhodosorus marinus, Strain UTEX LB 2760" /LENGTH=76 /DNA_ID=CAMNT_0027232653 /DNA_START=1185 /DNA_END=1415 /DNA_ORIENTATION=-